MSVAFFLTPKQDVVWLPAQAPLERAIAILARRIATRACRSSTPVAAMWAR